MTKKDCMTEEDRYLLREVKRNVIRKQERAFFLGVGMLFVTFIAYGILHSLVGNAAETQKEAVILSAILSSLISVIIWILISDWTLKEMEKEIQEKMGFS